MPSAVARSHRHLVRPGALSASRPRRKPYTTWSDYGGSADSMQYSALTQITKENVQPARAGLVLSGPGSQGQLRLQSDRCRRRDVRARTEQTRSSRSMPTTGKQIWAHVVEGGSPGNRGINYWESEDRSDRRLIFGAGGFLRAIDARTGAPIRRSASTGA